jgi:hypothetical protein
MKDENISTLRRRALRFIAWERKENIQLGGAVLSELLIGTSRAFKPLDLSMG